MGKHQKQCGERKCEAISAKDSYDVSLLLLHIFLQLQNGNVHEEVVKFSLKRD